MVKSRVFHADHGQHPVGERGGGSNQDEKYMSSHRPYLLENDIHDPEDAVHREAVARHIAQAKAICYNMPEKIWTGNIYPHEIDDKEKKPVEMNPKVKKFYREHDCWELHKDAHIVDNIHGYCYYVRLWKDGEPRFRIVSVLEIKKVKYDKLNEPITLMLKSPKRKNNDKKATNTDTQKPITINEKDFIFVSTRAGRRGNLHADSILIPNWDDYLDFKALDASETLFGRQHAPATPLIRVPPNTDPDEQDELASNFENVRHSTALLVVEGRKDDVEFSYVTPPSKAMDYKVMKDGKIESILTANMIPKRGFIGDPKGALAAADEDGLANIQRLQEMFLPWRRVIKEFNEKFIEVEQDENQDWWCVPNYKATEKSLAEVEAIRLQTLIEIKGQIAPTKMIWEEIYPNIPLPKKLKEYADVPLAIALQEINSQYMDAAVERMNGGNDDKNNDHPDGNKQPGRDMVKKADSMSDHEIMKKYKTRKNVAGKMKQFVRDISMDNDIPIPTLKTDSLKMDSLVDKGDHWEIHGKLMDGEKILPYEQPDGTISHEINDSLAIAEMYDNYKNKTFDLGVTDEKNDHGGLIPKGKKIGNFTLTSAQSNFVGKVMKTDAANHYWLLEKIANKEPLQVSAAYDSIDIPVNDGKICKKHTNIRLFNAVITKGRGRCGDSCSA